MSHHIIEIEHLRHVYPDGTEALHDVTFSVTHGESVAVIGANGAGKSTLLAHLNGHLLSESGEVRIGHVPVSRASLDQVRRTVGMVFQDPDDQLFMPTVREDVAFGPMNLGITGEELKRCVADALCRVDAEHLAEKAPYHLSAGEKRRVAIATVLSMSPNVLVMDEPTNGLDPYARRQLIGLLKDFRHSKIITSHDLDMVLEVCERTIVLSGGAVRADGPTREIFRDERLLRECRLEKPLSMQGCPVCGG
ncbi:energy-coupling factor ABC transporter ATP-binding protein [Geomonas edaphica]|uniref:energy-coupling factor ABC transporter ATP-binding protein n=1 Tax=Geomonas edaphica TaxID=2570226 RepID=UPI0010A80CC2|nr:ABC transporter ATP-binding protein [Geomonas edaphica]